MSLLNTVRESWGWTGLEATQIVESNLFGNLIVLSTDGSYWRICPEEWSCEQIASDSRSFVQLFQDDAFQSDWQMTILVEGAEQQFGPPADGQCYCLKIPAIVGGTYEITNVGTISLQELISASGEMAAQIVDVPDGGKIEIRVLDDG